MAVHQRTISLGYSTRMTWYLARRAWRIWQSLPLTALVAAGLAHYK